MIGALTAAIVCMAIALVWLAVEVRKVNDALGPLANSNIGQALARL